MTKKKKVVTWTGVGSVITGLSTGVAFMVKEFKDDESQINHDEAVIQDLNSKILDQNNLIHNLMGDVRSTLSHIYKDIGELRGALNVLLQKEVNDVNRLESEIHDVSSIS